MSVSDQTEEQQQRKFRSDIEILASLAVLFGAVRLLHGVPWWAGGAVLVGGVVLLRPKVVAVALVLLLAARTGAALDSLQPSTTGVLTQEVVVLVSDPQSAATGWTAQGKLNDERVMLSVQFGAGLHVGEVALGDELTVSGTLRGDEPNNSWAISQRLVGRVSVTDVHSHSDAGGPIGMANWLRATYRNGVSHMSFDDQALFTGLLFGDDRNQDEIDADNFRAAGLGHLLAVSGQNVVFVLLLAAPVLSRVRSVPVRVVLSVVVLVGFGFLTRFEASVLRALVMAGFVLVAHSVGRGGSAGLVLVPAVGVLLVVDPLLGWSLAFQLSVAATVGMVVLAPRIGVLVPGPEWLGVAVGATLGAQVFVSPLVLGVFGRLSVVAVPANVLAGPAAAGVMMWGLVSGLVAGLVPPLLAQVLHVPTVGLLWWVRGVAKVFGSLGVGHFSWWHLVVALVGLGVLLVPKLPRRLGVVLVVLVVGSVLVVPRSLGPGVYELGEGVTVARSSELFDVVVLDAGVRVDDVLEQLRTARLGRIDLLIARSGGRQVGVVVHVLDERFEIETIWAPPGHQVPGAHTVEDMTAVLGSLAIVEQPNGEITFTEGTVFR